MEPVGDEGGRADPPPDSDAVVGDGLVAHAADAARDPDEE